MELPRFLGALYGGLVIGVLYDVFSLLRLPLRAKLAINLVDAFFYAAAGIVAALTLLYINGGAPRLYAFLGLAFGAFIYRRFVSKLFRALFASISRVFKRKGG